MASLIGIVPQVRRSLHPSTRSLSFSLQLGDVTAKERKYRVKRHHVS